MDRFRPNFVVREVSRSPRPWKKIRIGDTVFHVVKPCARCVITTVDQNSGVKTGAEPLRTLAEFRKKRGKVLFAQNLIAERAGGKVTIGGSVEVLEYNKKGPAPSGAGPSIGECPRFDRRQRRAYRRLLHIARRSNRCVYG